MSDLSTANNPIGWHPADIVAAVRKNGSSLIAISASLGVTRPAASRALIIPNRRVNLAIAAFIGESIHALWPQWYDARGARIRRKRSKGNSSESKNAGDKFLGASRSASNPSASNLSGRTRLSPYVNNRSRRCLAKQAPESSPVSSRPHKSPDIAHSRPDSNNGSRP